MEDMLQNAGFVSIRPTTIRIPLQMNHHWDNQIGTTTTWLKAAMACSRDPNGTDNGFVGLILAYFTRHLGWPASDVRELCKNLGSVVLQETDYPYYINLHVWTARRPRMSQN